MSGVPFLRSSMLPDEVMHYASLGLMDAPQDEIAEWLEAFVKDETEKLHDAAFAEGLEEGRDEVRREHYQLQRAADELADAVQALLDGLPESTQDKLRPLINDVRELT